MDVNIIFPNASRSIPESQMLLCFSFFDFRLPFFVFCFFGFCFLDIQAKVQYQVLNAKNAF